MLDIKWVRNHPELVKAGALKKHFPERAGAVERVLELDRKVRETTAKVDDMRAEQKRRSRELGSLAADERAKALDGQKAFKSELQALEEQQRDLREQLDEQALLLPNVPDDDVPEGKDDSQNVEVRRVGELPDHDHEVRALNELGEAQGWMDFKSAVDIAGSRNYMLLVLVRDFVMMGTAFFPGGEEQTYRCEKDGLNLIGTSEVPVTAIHSGQILDEKDLPKLYVGRSVCFRREAGTYGKDTKGLYRVHQFQKVEQVVVDVDDEKRSMQHHENIVGNAEAILQALELPYRVVNVCGGDLGVPQKKKYDIECWMPSRGGYGETHSASRMNDFQARRLRLRYRRKEDRKVTFCHTLNNTVLASPRILIPLLEIHQQADGTVRIPPPLVPYMGGREVIGKPL
ncbi:MAG: serine--tRNA ligase [Planctomycetota bacterium]